MLVLTRKIGEMIRIGEEIELVVVDVSRGRVKLGFAGPRSIRVRRSELGDDRAEQPVPNSALNACASRPIVAASAAPGRPLRAYRAELANACTQG